MVKGIVSDSLCLFLSLSLSLSLFLSLSFTSLLIPVIHLLWRPVVVAECSALQMVPDEGSWVMLKDWPQCFIIPRESDPKGRSTHTGLILEQLISSQETFMCVGVSSRVLCCS